MPNIQLLSIAKELNDAIQPTACVTTRTEAVHTSSNSISNETKDLVNDVTRIISFSKVVDLLAHHGGITPHEFVSFVLSILKDSIIVDDDDDYENTNNNNTSSSSSSTTVLTIQQQLAYLLALFHTCEYTCSTTFEYNDNDNDRDFNKTTLIKSIMEGIYDFIFYKFERTIQITSSRSNEKNQSLADNDNLNNNNNNNDNVNNSYIQNVVLWQPMTYFIALLEYVLRNTSPPYNDKDKTKMIIIEPWVEKLKSLMDKMKSKVNAATNTIANNQIRGTDINTSTNDTISLNIHLHSLNTTISNLIPTSMKEKLDSVTQDLFQNDYDSFQILKHALEYEHSHDTSSSSFIRPLPHFHTFTSQWDIFQNNNQPNQPSSSLTYTSIYNNQENNNNDNQNETQRNNNTPSSSSSPSPSSSYLSDQLHFLHPPDPSLRFLWMNSGTIQEDKEEDGNDNDNINGEITNQDYNMQSHHTSSEKDKATKSGSMKEYNKEIQNILSQAFHTSLDIDLEEQLLQFLSSSSSSASTSSVNQRHSNVLKVIFDSGLSPQNLPLLVKYNHTIANKCLMFILLAKEEGMMSILNHDISTSTNAKTGKGSSNEKNNVDHIKKQYLSSLVQMDMSLESMEVVYQLATYVRENYNEGSEQGGGTSDDNGVGGGGGTKRSIAKQSGNHGRKHSKKVRRKDSRGSTQSKSLQGSRTLLNAEYMHMFVSNCISSCENTQDRNRQYKYVRLFSVFLHTLIQKNIFQVEDLYIEVQQFCIKFSRVEEAASLFKLLKETQTR